MKKEKPRESESEKLQRQQAKIFFDKGTAVKRVVGKKFVADMKRDKRSQQAAMSSADGAIVGRKALNAKRKGKKVNIADASTASAEVSIAAQNQSGISRTERLVRGASRSAQSANNAMNSVRAMSSFDHNKDLTRMKQNVDRKNDILSAVSAGAGLYLDKKHKTEMAEKEKVKEEEHYRRINEIFNGGY